jgi:hypothetical protein
VLSPVILEARSTRCHLRYTLRWQHVVQIFFAPSGESEEGTVSLEDKEPLANWLTCPGKYSRLLNFTQKRMNSHFCDVKWLKRINVLGDPFMVDDFVSIRESQTQTF